MEALSTRSFNMLNFMPVVVVVVIAVAFCCSNEQQLMLLYLSPHVF